MASKSKIYFVFEYVKGGGLFNKLSKGRLKEDVARKYFQQLLSAVDFCHSRGVYHRDLKPENLLLDENGNLKVSDFGLSAFDESKRQDGLLYTACGTPAYVAPEVINRKGYDGARADIWSCGVILFVLMAGYLLFEDPNLMEMYRKIRSAEFKPPSWFPSDVRRLITRILDPNPETRVSIEKITENSWFRKGFDAKQRKKETEAKELAQQDISASFNFSHQSNATEVQVMKSELVKPINLNAFDIISLSAGFNISGLFEKSDCKRETRFTSTKPALTIFSKLEEVAKRLRLKIKKKEGLKFKVSKESLKGDLTIDVEVFELTHSCHLVEIRKTNDDAYEYHKLLNQDMRPALKDIVWAWQGDSLST